MNSWDYNELTQEDVLDFKACRHNQTGKIYGIKDSSTCQSGKEVSKDELAALAKKANSGDRKAMEQLRAYSKDVKKIESDKKAAAKAAEEKKKAEMAAAKGKKGKKGGGKKGGGKKGGGKGKAGGGKGKAAAKKGSGTEKSTGTSQQKAERTQLQANAKKAQAKAAQARAARAKEVRSRIGELQKTLRQIKNPDVRAALEQQISDALKSVSELMSGKKSAATTPQPGAPAAPAPQPPAKNEKE